MATLLSGNAPSAAGTFDFRQHALTPDQSACFYAMRADLHAVSVVSNVIADDFLLAAFSRGTSANWSEAVRAVKRVLNLASASTPVGSQSRLAQFVAENADLLQSDDR